MFIDNISHFAVNISDLTRLNKIELLLISDKIDSHSKVIAEKNKFDGSAVLLHSTLQNDYSDNFKQRQKQQLYQTCRLLTEKCNCRCYYTRNGKTFKKLKF